MGVEHFQRHGRLRHHPEHRPDGNDLWEVGQHNQPVPVTKGWLRASHRQAGPAALASVPAVPRSRRALVADAERAGRMSGGDLADQHGLQKRPQAAPGHPAARRRGAAPRTPTIMRTTMPARRTPFMPEAGRPHTCCCRLFHQGRLDAGGEADPSRGPMKAGASPTALFPRRLTAWITILASLSQNLLKSSASK